MADISEVKKMLDKINAAVSAYDPVIKEQARDILLKEAFGAGPLKHGPAAKNDSKSNKGMNDVDGEQQVPFNALIERWTPTTQADWALLGAYYFQRVVGNQNVMGLQVNKELKQHGYGVTNITDCFTTNMNADPARMLQTKKAGKSRQAKKLYLVTIAGIKYVEEKLNSIPKR